jgi:hypothetical protein
MANPTNLTTGKAIEWRIAFLCAILFLFLSGLEIHLKQCHFTLPLVPNFSDKPATVKVDDLNLNPGSLQEKIGQKQAQLQDLETKLGQIEGIAREKEDELTELYRKISDLKGGIEGDKSKLRLRGHSCSP